MSKALKTAIEANDPAAVQAALKAVKDIHRKLPGAKTPLLYASEKGADRVLETLFAAGAVAEKRNTFPGDTPFAVAAQYEQGTVLARLVELKQASEEAIDHALTDAFMDGRTTAAKLVLEAAKPAVTLELFNVAGCSPKRVEMVRLLIAHGGNPNIRSDDPAQKDVTPLHVAAGRGQPDVMKLLVESGADVNARDARGRTPLMAMAEQLSWLERDRPSAKTKEALMALLKLGADATLCDLTGNDALMHYEFECSRDGEKPSAQLVALLRDAGAKGMGATGNLFEALRKKDLFAIRRAIEEGADVNHVNSMGGTPLMWAGTDEIVEVLLEAGADPNKGCPLISAAGSGHLSIVKRLIEAGADIHAMEVTGEYRSNAYSAAQMNRKYDVADYLKSLGAGLPKPKKSESIKAGVGSWNDFSEVLVKGTTKAVADALARMIQGAVHLDVFGKTFQPGGRAYVVVRPKGLNWCNVFQIAPPPNRFENYKVAQTFAKELAKVAGAPVLSVEYSDTSDAASIFRAEPNGKSFHDKGWDRDTLQEMVDAMGDEAPDWATKQLAKTSDDEPSSTERLVMLAESEKFAVAAFGFYCEAGRPLDIEVTGYGADAFDGVAFVSD